MQTGVLSPDNLDQILRGLSTKRRQGILEVTIGETILNVIFVAGKIVDAFEVSERPFESILNRMKLANLVEADFELESYTDYSLIFEELHTAGSKINLEEYKLIIEEHVLNILYTLNLGAGAYYIFKVQMVEHSPEIQPSISVGQLLLDLVGMAEEEQKYQQLFPEEMFIKAQDSAEGTTDAERLFIRTLKNPRTLEDAQKASLLSRFHFQEALISLFESGQIVEVSVSDHADIRTAEESLDDIVAALEGSLEEDIDIGDMEDIAMESSQIETELESSSSAYDQELEEELEPVRVSYLGLFNARLLQASWLIHVMAVLFLICFLFAPIVAWNDCISAFSKF